MGKTLPATHQIVKGSNNEVTQGQILKILRYVLPMTYKLVFNRSNIEVTQGKKVELGQVMFF